jgi:hypothetical protein
MFDSTLALLSSARYLCKIKAQQIIVDTTDVSLSCSIPIRVPVSLPYYGCCCNNCGVPDCADGP